MDYLENTTERPVRCGDAAVLPVTLTTCSDFQFSDQSRQLVFNLASRIRRKSVIASISLQNHGVTFQYGTITYP